MHTQIRMWSEEFQRPNQKRTKPIFDAIFVGVSLCVSRLLNSINYRELWLCQRFWIHFNQVIFIEFEILKKKRTISKFSLSSIIMIVFFFLFQYTLPCIKGQKPDLINFSVIFSRTIRCVWRMVMQLTHRHHKTLGHTDWGKTKKWEIFFCL